MQLKLKSNFVKELHIIESEPSQDQRNKIQFDYETLKNINDNQEFVVIFDFSLYSDKGYQMNLKHSFTFECDEDLDEDFWNGNFHKVNAPAIAYPYLRAFVSTILLNAGLESVYLPSVNFVEMAKNTQK